jgi:glycogen synthase
MYVIQIAPECAPVAKVGGLGDVVFGLSRELEIRGHSVEIIIPKYDCLRFRTVPVARAAGGPAGTRFDAGHVDKPYHERNGYTFNPKTEIGFTEGNEGNKEKVLPRQRPGQKKCPLEQSHRVVPSLSSFGSVE